MELPGGDGFVDVGDLFKSASAEMVPGEMVWTEGFSLLDAMSALEIGEPRLDSGMISEQNRRPPFEPLRPMLPEEICWIIDQSFAYEMEWHAGNLFSNSVFTLVYVHELDELDPDLVPYKNTHALDSARPVELISVVLRTYIFGLLKCCGLAWDILNRSPLHDGEDWQSDKCEVSLLEGYQVNNALAKFDETLAWMSFTTKLSEQHKQALHLRLTLRKTLLKLINTNLFDDLATYQSLIFQARDILHYLRANPAPTPSPSSPAHLAFDPYIARRLITFIPIRVLNLPPMGQTWDQLEKMLDGWYEMSLLSKACNVSTWHIVGNLRIWSDTDHAAHVRARTTACFYDGVLVLGRYMTSWVSKAFFSETLGTSQDAVWKIIQDGWNGRGQAPLMLLERTLYKTLISSVSGCWHNAPRRRRHLMHMVYEWHVAYDMLLALIENVETSNPQHEQLIQQLPNAALLWRLDALRELVLSGLQLELYASDERPFAYWYTAYIIEKHLECIDSLVPVIPFDSPTLKELTFKRQFLVALRHLCTAVYIILKPTWPFDWQKSRPNFQRRYKWVFDKKYGDLVATPVGHPELIKFFTEPVEATRDAVGECEKAYGALEEMIRQRNIGGWAAFVAEERMKFVQVLAGTADNLRKAPDLKTLKWNPEVDPWFPRFLGK